MTSSYLFYLKRSYKKILGIGRNNSQATYHRLPKGISSTGKFPPTWGSHRTHQLQTFQAQLDGPSCAPKNCSLFIWIWEPKCPNDFSHFLNAPHSGRVQSSNKSTIFASTIMFKGDICTVTQFLLNCITCEVRMSFLFFMDDLIQNGSQIAR